MPSLPTALTRGGRLILWSILIMTSTMVQAQFNLDREPPGPSTRRTGLIISEIMYNPLPVPGLETNLTLEFIEIYNTKPWPEDIGGYAISGDVSYVFEEGTTLDPGAYLVLARVPGLVETNYGISGVLGPWEDAEDTRLSVERGLVQLLNRQGAVLLLVDYRDSPPWPEGADGTGHSLVLARPSYGEESYLAWAQSDTVGGSPGQADPLSADPLASVLINEWQNHSDPSDWIELYNHSNVPVDLSGARLADNPSGTNFYPIPNGTILPARGFLSWDQEQMGFELFAGGETIFLYNPDRSRLIDVIDFRGQSNNISSGRYPDGGPISYSMSRNTPSGPNSVPMEYGVVINEIMYNPISGNSDEEYIEIYNRGDFAVDIKGWEFVVGISYTFPTNALTMSMPAGAHWVIARNPEVLTNIYPNLNTNNTFGPYEGSLANGGERVLFTAADYDFVGPARILEKLPIPVSDVTYADGGKWGSWSDGQGSSLELIDPYADPVHPSSWTDSNNSGDSRWTSIEMKVPLGETLGPEVNDSLIVMMHGVGECLIDDIEVRADNGPNLVVNGGFESGLNGWSLQGSHDFSTLENEGFSGANSLHVRSGSRGDNQSNRILSAPLVNPVPASTGLVSIRAKVKWIRGFPEIYLRLHGSATEAFGRMALPRNLGSPGLPNTVLGANLGPAIYNVSHAPVLPSENEPVVVTAMVRDPQGVTGITLRYRLEPAPDYINMTMLDNGTAGDAIANDGVFSATLPGRPAGTMVAFHVEARDSQNALGTYPRHLRPEPGFDRTWPNDSVAQECMVRWGEMQMPGDFATYHLWVSSVNSNRWHTRNAMNNTEMHATFIYNNNRIIYDAMPLFSGSPWHRTNSITGPAGTNRVDYELNFPDDDVLLGSKDFVLNNPGNPDILTVSDQSAVGEQTVYQIFEGIDLQHNHRRYIHMFVNGSQRSTVYERSGNFIFEDSQQPNGDMIDQWYPNDAGGQLFKVEDWFEFDRNGFDVIAYDDGDLERRTIMVEGNPEFVPAPYRYKFRKRSINVGNSADDFTQLFELIDAVSPVENPDSDTINLDVLGDAVDWEAWMRHFAVQRAVGNFDSFGWERGKNDYLYQTSAGFVHMPWDIDYSLGLGRPADDPNLFESSDSRIRAMFNTPAIVRAYWRAFRELVDGPFDLAYLEPHIDARTTALAANNVNYDPDAVATMKTYISERHDFLLTQLQTVEAPFAVYGSTTYESTNNLVIITGSAPVGVKEIAINGEVYPVVWTSVTNYMLRYVLEPDVNLITLEGLDRFGEVVMDAAQILTVTYTGPVVNPVGSIVITEIMADPLAAGGQFIELQNRSAQNFGLTDWYFEGVNYSFPAGSILTNGQRIVLAQNQAVFRQTYGNLKLFGIFGGGLSTQGDRLILIKPDEMGGLQVDAIRYESESPWPEMVQDQSLQVIDPDQDNSRSSNWATDPVALATPGAENSVNAALPPFESVWLNEVQTENIFDYTDNAGELEPWVEIYNPGPNPVFLDGYYLTQNYQTNLDQWAFPVDASINPGEFKIVWLDAQPEQATSTDMHANFRPDFDGKLALVRFLGENPQITDYLTWDAPGANASYGDYPDGQPLDRQVMLEPTQGTNNVSKFPLLYINEWMAGNTNYITDSMGEYDDWFEIYNAGPNTVDLSDYYLSDNPLNPTKHEIDDSGAYEIPPGGFLLIWADEDLDQNDPDQDVMHVDFKLGKSSGSIGLYAPDGITEVDVITYGQQVDDISEGRYKDGANVIYTMPNPTPGRINTIPGYNTPPSFSSIPDQSLFPGERVTIVLTGASDPDLPVQNLTFSLEDPEPGMQINASGAVRWIVPVDQVPGEYLMKMVATDDGEPSRSGAGFIRFFILDPTIPDPEAAPPPIIHTFYAVNGQAVLTFSTVPGLAYRVLYKDSLDDPEWLTLRPDFVAANPMGSVTDFVSGPHRFYQVLVVE